MAVDAQDYGPGPSRISNPHGKIILTVRMLTRAMLSGAIHINSFPIQFPCPPSHLLNYLLVHLVSLQEIVLWIQESCILSQLSFIVHLVVVSDHDFISHISLLQG